MSEQHIHRLMPLLLACLTGCQGPAGADVDIATKPRIESVSLARFGVPPATVEEMQKKLRDLPSSGFDYPWLGLETNIFSMPGGKLALIGYGSLLNRDSAARSFPTTPAQGHPPVLAIGAQRVFNYVIPPALLHRYGGNFGQRENAALNLVYTRSNEDFFNGRLLLLDPKDIPALREREFGYDLMPVIGVRWNEWKSVPFVAYVLLARNERHAGRQILDHNALPHPPYANVCRSGASAVSESFLQLYLQTTYLADRRTTLKAWEMRHAGFPEGIPHSK